MPESFYEPSAEVVAPLLLGHWLIRKTPQGWCGGPIVEAEAYLTGDAASHGFIGQTPRTRVMYGPPGRTYVYLIYGNHFCVNAVCRPPGFAEAVLVRAVEAEFGEEILKRNRPAETIIQLTNGPGKLCAAMDIDRKLNEANLCDPDSPLIIARNPAVAGFRKERGPVIETTRVGITKAADLRLRFYLDGSPFVSKRDKQQPGIKRRVSLTSAGPSIKPTSKSTQPTRRPSMPPAQSRP